MCKVFHCSWSFGEMSALKRERVFGKSENELDELSCGICLEIIAQPMVTKCCQQMFCAKCIEEWLKRCKTCPNCRNVMSSEETMVAPRLVMNLLNEMPVKCEYERNGCPVVVAFNQMLTHLKSCQYKVCQTCGFRGKLYHKCYEILIDEKQRLSKQNENLKEQWKNNKIEQDKIRMGLEREIKVLQNTIDNLRSENVNLKTKQGNSDLCND